MKINILRIEFLPLALLLLIFYLYFFIEFFNSNSVLALSGFGYLAYFLWNDNFSKLQNAEESVKIKKDRKINFWYN